MAPITFFVPGVPQTKGSARGFPVRMKDGRVRAVITNDNEKTKPWQALVSFAAREAFRGAGPVLRPGGVVLVITYVLARPKGHFNAKGELKPTAPAYPTTKPDADKMERPILDALTAIAYEDDAQVARINHGKEYALRGQETGARIEVHRLPATVAELMAARAAKEVA